MNYASVDKIEFILVTLKIVHGRVEYIVKKILAAHKRNDSICQLKLF